MLHRHPDPWEVVDSQRVDPIPTHSEDDALAWDIVRISDTEFSGTYTFELKSPDELQQAVVSARKRLLQEMNSKSFNIMMTEGWQVTLQRKDTAYRAEVKYISRPAFITGTLPKLPPPPALSLLDRKSWHL